MSVPARDQGFYRALDAGLPGDLLAYLVGARAHWARENAGGFSEPVETVVGRASAAMFWQHVDEALAHPQAPTYDEVFVAAMRRRRGIR